MSASLLRALGVLMLLAAILAAVGRAPERSLQSLVPRWAPPPSDFLEMAGPTLPPVVHYRDEGPRSDPAPLLLLHGTASSLHTWEGWVRALQSKRRVITVDLPGFGLTGPTAAGDYSDAAYTDFVLAFMDQLKLRQVVLGGNSLGGAIAWQVALRAPSRVKALVLVDAGGYAFQPEQVPLGFQLASLPLVRDVFKSVLPRQVVRESLRSVYGDPGKVSDALVDRHFELTVREGNRDALMQRMDQFDREGRQAARITQLQLPTLILWGGRDRLIPPRWGQQFAKDIADSQLTVFDSLGHMPHEEDPQTSAAVLSAFLDQALSRPVSN